MIPLVYRPCPAIRIQVICNVWSLKSARNIRYIQVIFILKPILDHTPGLINSYATKYFAIINSKMPWLRKYMPIFNNSKLKANA